MLEGNLLAVRDSDYSAFAWWPRVPELDRWMSLYQEVTARNGAEADAGRCLLGWVRAAGFADPVMSSSTWTFATPDEREWWGGLWAERCTSSSLAGQAVEYGLASADDLAALAAGWHTWAADPHATFIVVHGEVLARAPDLAVVRWPADVGWSDLGTPERLAEWLAHGTPVPESVA